MSTGNSWEFSEDLLDRWQTPAQTRTGSHLNCCLAVAYKLRGEFLFPLCGLGTRPPQKCGHRARIHSRGPQSGYCPNSWEGGLGMRLSPTDMLRDGWQTLSLAITHLCIFEHSFSWILHILQQSFWCMPPGSCQHQLDHWYLDSDSSHSQTYSHSTTPP